MDSQKPNTKTRGGKGNISLEDYLDFIESHEGNDLTINYLNQIVAINGFRKIWKVTKNVIIDAVNSIELMNPSRSTLKEDISSCAVITLEEVITDLEALNWQECKVTSLQTINSSPDETLSTEKLSLQNPDQSKSKSKKKSRAVVDIYSNGDDCSGVVQSGTSASSQLTMARKRKKRVSKAVDHGGDCSGVVQSGMSALSQLTMARKRKKRVSKAVEHGGDCSGVAQSGMSASSQLTMARKRKKRVSKAVDHGGDCSGVAQSDMSSSSHLLLGSY